MEHYDFVDKRFDDLNEINSLGHGAYSYDEPVKKLEYPADVSNENNYLGFQEVELFFPTYEEKDMRDIVEYFAKLGKHLSESQDGVYITMATDDLGVHKIHIDFPRCG